MIYCLAYTVFDNVKASRLAGSVGSVYFWYLCSCQLHQITRRPGLDLSDSFCVFSVSGYGMALSNENINIYTLKLLNSDQQKDVD